MFKFFVYIVESPSDQDLYRGDSEGRLLAGALRLDRIPAVTRTVINYAAFNAALTTGLAEAMRNIPDRHPILHLSAHGAKHGIQLSSGQIFEWSQLRNFLVPINRALNDALVLCMSACEGYNACRMAMQVGDQFHPFLCMVGTPAKPTWSDTAVGYLAFYHLLAQGKNLPEAVQALTVSSGNPWFLETAANLQQSFVDYIRDQTSTPNAHAQMATEIEQINNSPSAPPPDV